jgi:hypothetical protein
MHLRWAALLALAPLIRTDNPNGVCRASGIAAIICMTGCSIGRMRYRPFARMKLLHQRTIESIVRGVRRPRTLWLFLASVVALGFASRHTLPLHGGSLPDNPFLEVLRTVAAFTLAGLCVALARASLNSRIDIRMIGYINGLYAVVVSIVISGAAPGSLPQVLIGGVLATGGAMLGASLAKSLLH